MFNVKSIFENNFWSSKFVECFIIFDMMFLDDAALTVECRLKTKSERAWRRGRYGAAVSFPN